MTATKRGRFAAAKTHSSWFRRGLIRQARTMGLLLCLSFIALYPVSQAFCQEKPAATATAKAKRASPNVEDEGELIELEAVEIQGEIAQPNVAITVSRAEPLFRELTLERTTAEGLNDLDLAEQILAPQAARISDWMELLEKPRQ